MPIIAKNMKVGVVNPAPTEAPKARSFTDLREIIRQKLEEEKAQAPKKKIIEVNTPPQVTKELPKYVTKEHGELTSKINTKSQYMRDIFDLDS